MNVFALEPFQDAVLAALQALSDRMDWQGEAVGVEEALVFQVPLPNDPDVSGAFFVAEANEFNIRLYLTLPWSVPPDCSAAASEFVIRQGYGRKFGALEFDLDHGQLRVRTDVDTTVETLDAAIARLLDRAMALARDVSPAWRALARTKN